MAMSGTDEGRRARKYRPQKKGKREWDTYDACSSIKNRENEGEISLPHTYKLEPKSTYCTMSIKKASKVRERKNMLSNFHSVIFIGVKRGRKKKGGTHPSTSGNHANNM
ncbi:hypothetical protein KP509_35G011100 [Ceratopteris richardii]|uniref:Uncharacterized protein n=1 Tax=Ceratopteris richardii TaxID=49495 RepID=A0A8T2QER2_CERRI|nr:hypothetical protein KP509_35G011100 [Ceratopteris richardii]